LERAGARRKGPPARRKLRRPTSPRRSASAARADVEWPYYAGNLSSQRYSPLDQINRDNVGKLEIAWRFQTGNYGPKPEARNEATPLVIGGVLYTTVGVNAQRGRDRSENRRDALGLSTERR
jgi:glucose dehydrogenase